MRLTSIATLVTLFASFYFFASCVKEESEDTPDEVINYVEVGDVLPDFSVTDGMGTTLTDEDFKGKKSYLVFFVTTCGDCKRELPRIEQLWRQLKDEPDYQVVAIARKQGKDETDAYWNASAFTIPKYLDPDRTVYAKFANSMVPRIYLVDRQGVVQWMGIETFTPSDAELLEKIKSLP
ncbi:TlpA disulfide reductase family protein [Parabacteroides sp. PF5-6]|uniref:TlpA family protein disulfide reductase n=1 Tax=Parabacteroides sp. PF5-6 TaxID=1742403 RepID=UPI0024062F29|nr:TlpA disulfide reductase family protein [Parabacteroides sp. PF5-6]MDF9830390.1 peroxiredoxin [Parabacteroides sp. PF5-6]